MEIYWNIFWIIFWLMMFIGIGGLFLYLIKILRDISIILKTATSVSEQIQSISDIVEDIRMKANFGNFIDVLELSKRLFSKFKSSPKKH